MTGRALSEKLVSLLRTAVDHGRRDAPSLEAVELVLALLVIKRDQDSGATFRHRAKKYTAWPTPEESIARRERWFIQAWSEIEESRPLLRGVRRALGWEKQLMPE